uniref:Uncharacterized protein n=1 Tax=Amphora coffeiformis TaxID=265554 RepID=A0A7S3LCM0_9STRA
MKISGTSLLVLASALVSTSAFSVTPQLSVSTKSSTTALAAKGFGAPKKQTKKKSDGQVKREQESSKYDEIAASGGQQYSVFVRQFGSDDKSWLPCGSIAVPRNAQVSDAIFSNESALKGSIVRMYPKLRGYETEFEFGFNLKVYPDDPIEVAKKGASGKTEGPSIGNWISTLLSPVDAGASFPPKN